ncbi:MAG: threonylcarbamoyl-AMP synthase, partial [Oscillospiraceae bacterium]|nr:threonylcarbamoyl-AMP synthase [Oscillospiraceae bacterium]
MYTHVIFDLDGTLLNTIDDLADAGNHVCAAHGWPTHTVDEFKRMVGDGIPNLVSRFTPAGLGEDGLAQALAEFSAYYNAHKADKTAPYPGIPEALAALKRQGVHMAVLSNKAHALAGPVVEHYFPGVFEYVQGALPDAPLKPDPTLLHTLMGKIGAKPETTLFVGDSGVDVRTGKNGGLTVVGVLWGFRDRQELEDAGADHIIRYPEQLVFIATGTALLTAGQTVTASVAELLRMGRLVAVPTETVYGLAADATQEGAVQANYDAKGRPETKPLNVLVDGMSMVETVCRDIPEDAYKLAEAFWPGPLTMILWGNGALPAIVPAGGATQGVRCPDHPDTLAVSRALGRPLACPSANLSG